MDPKSDPDLTIVLLGKTGVGKSATGNTILGRPAFESKLSWNSVTTKISAETGNVFGKQISVVDTPGILDGAEEEITNRCQDILQSSRPCLFLVLLRVGRFTKEDQRAVKVAMRVLGRQGLKKSYLLFTGGDALENKTLDDFIFEVDEGNLPQYVKRMAWACHLFNNKNEDQKQVRELLLKSGHLRTSHISREPVSLEDRRIILLGLPGAGKSSSGNTILGSKKFKSGCGFKPVTTECDSESAIVEGHQVTVVDTPGLTNEVLTPKEMYVEIMKSIVKANPGPHAFVIVVRIGRISEADSAVIEMLAGVFENDASKHTMVLFTHGDELEGQSIDDLRKSSDHVSKLVSMCGGRFCVFDNKTKNNRHQVRRFLNEINEMVTANGGKHYTDEMFRMADTFFKEERNRSDLSTDRISSGPSDDRISSGPSDDRISSGPSDDRISSGPSDDRISSGPSDDRISSGPSDDRIPPGPSDGANRAYVVWQRLIHIISRLWDHVCNFFTQLMNLVSSIIIRTCVTMRTPHGSSESVITSSVLSLDSLACDSTETDYLIKKNK